MKELDESNNVTVKAATAPAAAIAIPNRNHFRNASSPTTHRWRARHAGEREPLIRRRSLNRLTEENELSEAQPVAGGTVLGIHNLAIVMPQFLVSPIYFTRVLNSQACIGCYYFKRDLQDCRHC